jgi:putative ABC transport system substrate-binding protein
MIPIVFNVGGDPVEMGLVSSVSRPGANITGVNILTTELAAKRLALLHDLLPPGTVFAHLVNPSFPPSEANVREVQEAGRLLGRKIVLMRARNEQEIDSAFDDISKIPAGAVLIGADPYFNSRRNQIIALAARYSIPAGYEVREYTLAGGLISYGTSLTESYRQIGIYVGRILKGEKPGDLPVMGLTKLDLIINLKTAASLGLTIPPSLLARADEVIE